MKVLPFEIPKTSNRAFLLQVDKGAAFYGRLHRHEEIQISLIVEGRGDLIVAESIHSFEAGELYIIGGNTPHLFRSVEQENDVYMITIFFTMESFGKGFFDIDEMHPIKELISSASVAIRFPELKADLQEQFKSLEKSKEVQRIVLFLDFLDRLSRMEPERLSSFRSGKISVREGERMGNVMDYAMAHYADQILLDEVASVAHMTTNAFCRYFKQRTNKSFFQFITELRMAHAQRLLRQTDKTVLEIAYATGFKNISHFNRKFLQSFGCNPTTYRKRMANKNP